MPNTETTGTEKRNNLNPGRALLAAQNTGTKKPNRFNPFRKLEGEPDARSAAKNGALVGGYLALSYLIQAALVYWGGKDGFGNTGMETLIADGIGILFGMFLVWRILVRQPLWAAILVAVWFGIEVAAKIIAIVEGTQRTNVGYVFMFIALVAAVILSLRGSWTLRALRRSALRT